MVGSASSIVLGRMIIAAALLTSLTSALPYSDITDQYGCLKTIPYVDTFDNTSPLTGVLPAVGSKVQPEGALNYNAWNYVNGALDTVLDLHVPSSPNAIATALVGQLIDGRPFITPANDTILAFDVDSLYFVCGVGDVLSVGVLAACTVQLTGVRASTGETVVHELLFKPDLLVLSQNYTFVKLPDTFKNLVQVDIQVLQSGIGVNADIVPLFDNIAYSATFDHCLYPEGN